jgi:hypothetical protein
MYKLADGSGGTANPPAAPDSPTGIDVPIEGDRSDSEIDLINKIDEELGLPKQPINEDESTDEKILMKKWTPPTETPGKLTPRQTRAILKNLKKR